MSIANIEQKIRVFSEITPNKTAIEFGEKKVSYLQLDEITSKVANFLMDKYEDTKKVFIMTERGPSQIEALIGVVKSGGIFIPIDPDVPDNRIITMLQEVQSNWIITTSTLVNRLNKIIETIGLKMNVLLMESNNDVNACVFGNLNVFSMENINKLEEKYEYYPNKHCYIYFTSGSTGKPKGVLGRHRSLLQFIEWEIKEMGVNSEFRVSQLTSPSFDPFLRDVFVPLCAGGTLCIPDSQEFVLNPIKLIEWIEKNHITLIHTVPSVFKVISNEIGDVEKFSSLKYILLAGEILRGNDIKKFMDMFHSKVQLVNLYGPTETTLAKLFYRINESDSNKAIIPVGKPIDFTDVLILNESLEVCPTGIVGEIYIRTPFITSGYCNDKELTKKVFFKNPFTENPKDIIYKTGDLGRMFPDGNVEIVGRADNQVKIRGMRIELGEIENRLLQHNSISETVVMAKEDEDTKYLCAYIISNEKLEVNELRKFLSKYLPEAMVPSHFIQVDKMPLTTSGKIDRKKLLTLQDFIESEIEYVAPKNEIEEKLVEMWANILKRENIGVENNFFELGGHSLKAARFVGEIHKEFNVEISLVEFFEAPIIRKIAEYIEKADKNIYVAIEKTEEREYYPVSSAQRRMFITNQLSPESTNYNLPIILKVEGKLNTDQAEKAMYNLILRHESLRTSFHLIEGEIFQKINTEPIKGIKYSNSTEENLSEVIKKFIKPFNFKRGQLIRLEIVTLSEGNYILMFDKHHIISDGSSTGIFVKEFLELYQGKELEELRIQYKDYSQWQNSLLKSKVMEEQKEYWINRFGDEIPVLNIRSDFERPLIQSFEGESISFKLDKELTKNLRRISKETGSTMYMLLLSGINILLSKYSGQEDIVVGSPIAGRPHADLEKIIGMFVNTLAMRNYPDGNKTYENFLKEVKENALKAYENQDYQFDELVDKLSIPRDISRNPLFDVAFTMKNIDLEEIPLKDLVFKEYKEEHKVAKFDLTFSASEMVENIILNIQYSTKLYKRETIDRMMEHFKNILEIIVENKDIKLSDIDMLSEEERHRMLYEFNDKYVGYPRDKTIHELFEEQVEKTPDNIAVVFEEKKLSYRELNERANRLATILREKGVKPDAIVGIMVERSLEMIVGIMAILKAGGAYLPIDSEYPEDRIKYMIQDSESYILLTQSKFANKVEFSGQIIEIDKEEIYQGKSKNLAIINDPNNLAYVIYTSGSTGMPKGVTIEHRTIVNTIRWRVDYYKYTDRDVTLQMPSFSFDSSVEDIFTSLIKGGKLVLLLQEKRLNTEYIRSIIEKNNVGFLLIVPSLYRTLLNEIGEGLKKLKAVTVAGENCSKELVVEHFEKLPNVELYNEYGPTENSVCTSAYKFDKEDINIYIGKPIRNVKCYIISDYNKMQPVGIPGELVISGKGLARGYLNNEETTAEKFISNPFLNGEKMYKTGDLARWTNDGNIQFLGRIDNQVKIRGFRIELEEIESQLLSHELIKEAIVVDRTDKNGDKYLCAYMVATTNGTLGELREHLSKNLPEYMIPSYFIELDKIPLTSNGKVDRKLLPEPDGNMIKGTEYEASRNEVEENLVKIWSEVLGVEKIGINDNFFELGGHSLKAITLIAKIHKELNSEIPLKEIFKSPTIKGISEYIESTEKSIYSSIEILEEKEYYEASSAQKRMYMLQQFDLKSTGYNMPGVMVIEGELSAERLEKSFIELIRRHETLRTSFETIEDKIVQRVNESVNFKLDCFEVGFLESTDKAVDNIVSGFVKAFDLNKAPLLRVGLIKLEEDKHILMFDMHHIISDGVSMGILTNEFVKIYEGNKLEQLRIQYKDYSQWQNSLLKSAVMQEQKEYWINRFKDEIPVLNIRADFKRPTMQSFEGDSIGFKLDKELTKNLKRISKETGSTIYMVLLSGLNILLSKYSGQKDIIIGSPIAGRPHADLEKIIGMFVNTLAMRNYPEESRTYEDFLKEVKENALKAYENGDYQFDELVDQLSIPRDISRNPLFDVMFTMQNTNSEEAPLKDLVFKGYKQEHKVAKFDLTFSGCEVNEEVIFELQYSTKLYKRETIERMIEHFVNIIKVVTGDIKIKLSEIEMITEEEKHKMLFEFNDTYADYPRDKTIHELFEEQAQKTPNNVAIVFEDKKITYRELNERSNRLARNLRGKGVKPDSIVGIMVERSIEMIVGMLGVLKSGGAYLPIDPEYPVDRIGYMIEDSNANILLTQSNLIGMVEFHGEVIDLEDEEIYSQKVDNLEKINNSGDLAYVIYTSGSTGRPKGVMIEHRSIATTLQWRREEYKLNSDDSILQLFSNAFDAFVTSFYTPLISGSEAVILSASDARDVLKIRRNILLHKITHLIAVPSMCLEIIENLTFEEAKSLRVITLGGEGLTSKIVEKCKNLKEELEIVNEYGPTENSVVTTIMRDIHKDKQITIGSPKANTRIYIVDKKGKLQSIGVPGELCISGEGLARGYLNKLELTSEKFIESPFVSGERMYKTGDLARWLADGNIEFLGRIDHQVKIRGFRIELGEIESQLLNHESVKEVIVLDREDENGSKYLCAYLVSEKELTVGELRSYLSKNLPEYMIPSYFVQLEKMPLTPNGKIDRKAVPEPDGSIATGIEYEAPRNEVEEKLVVIWEDVLGRERIGINDNFFELGGHSLKATTLVSKIHKELNVEVSLREIFKFPTIKGINEYIENTEKIMYSSIEPVEEREYYEASSAQKRMYLLQQFDLKSTGYNMPGVMLVEGELSAERLEKSFIELIRRHETLRTSFETIEDKIVQRVNESVNFKLDCFEVGCMESTDKAVDNIVKDFIKAFDLNTAPLLRVGLIKLEAEKHILMFDMHHIISDGVSMGILINEFANIYEGHELEGLRIQYKDYSQWQNNILNSEIMKEQKEYWINRFKDDIPVLNMPTDFQRPLMQSFEGENISFKLDKELTKDLKRIAKETGSTMYMVLLSGVNILLSKYSGQEDIIVGSPISGRPHADLEKIIGMFVNTLAMRNYPEGSRLYEDFLKEVKENALKAYENQEYQFDELVDQLSIPRDISRNPLFDVMFTMQNMNSEEIELKDLAFKGYKQEHKVAKFDLTFSASEMVENIILNFEYSTKLYKKETIETMIEHFVNILKSVATNTKIKLSEIDMLTEKEKHKLLYEFNDTYLYYPSDKTIHELFEEQAQKTPDNVAVVFEDKEITYSELNEKANRLGKILREKGVKSNSLVGIMVERSIDMIVGIMGVIKAGGAYLPVDSKYPEDRIDYMLQDSKTDILLTQSKFIGKLKFSGELINLEDEKSYSNSSGNLENINTSKDLAYVIYTSGSTGNPKGVMIEHKNVLNLIFGLHNNIYSNYGLNLNIALVAPYVFDASVQQIFPAILLGHKLFIVPEEARTSGELLLEYYNNNVIDISDGTPVHMNMLINARHKENARLNVKRFIIGGDVLTCETVRKFYDKFAETKPSIVNIYGPTECCVDSIFYDIDMNKIKDLEIIPIGKPMCNESIYILGKNLEILPVGIVGEIYIAGEGVGRGYLNRAELTAEKFIESPFISGERVYKTGDLARWLPDGHIEFLGRIDHQVKVRGFRIELGEIESQLLNHESIKEAIVLDREDKNGVKYLCSYLVSEKELTVGELRSYLLKKLPEYMIPSYFVQLDKMPLTANGKIDRKALPKPDGSIITGVEYEVARNQVEEKLVAIWKEVLGTEKVGINDNFFELGGHSLKATALVSKIHKELNVEVPLREIFKSPTIKGTSEYIQSTEMSIYSSIGIVEEKEYYEASSAQKRMYMLQQYDLDSTGYNMPGVMVLEGKFEAQRIEKSFAELIRRHETLRTSFETIEGKIVQRVNESVNFKLNCFEVGFLESQIKDVDNIVKGFVKAFDLNKAPLLRVGLIKLEEDKHILMFDMHHIISDGVSMGILTNEFSRIYEGDKLAQLRIQYKDYSAWQNSLLKSEVIEEQKEYWINRFKDEIPVLNIRADFQRPLIQSFEGENIRFKLDKELTKDLKRISKETGSTMYMVLLSAVNILLSKYSGQEDIIVGSPIAGRPHADLEKIIGIFVNTLAMRNHPEASRTYEDFLREVKENALKAYENQDYQFDELVDKLSIPRDISRNPLFDVMFTMQNIDSEDIEQNDFVVKGYKQEHKAAKFDLTFSASEVKEEVIFELQYSTKLYKRETIEIMVEHFVNILKAVAEDTKIKLSEIDMLTEGEKHKLLFEFNDTYSDYPREKTIYELFEEQVEKTPDSIAVVYENRSLTYMELNQKSNRLARTLREKGIKPDSIVGIMVDRSLEMIVGIIGILKSGGAYLPIDPQYPQDRIRYMLQDSETKIILTQEHLLNKVDFNGVKLNLQDENVYSGNMDNLGKVNTSKNLAYVIYTSGSTGNPKGVMIEHCSVVNRLNWMQKKYPITFDDVILQKTTYTFDVSVWELIWWSLVGAKVCLLPQGGEKDLKLITNAIECNKVTVMHFVPSMLNMFLDYFEKEENVKRIRTLKQVFSSGEALSLNQAKRFNEIFYKNKGIKLCNLYGPTEATVDVSFFDCSPLDNLEVLPIGKPIDNIELYILDKKNNIQPIGISGELCISGEGLARGYLNKVELTAEKFIESPFVYGERIYKTGDLARWMPDGNIEFLGRIDHQVKIRGFRIELGEIESNLLTHKAVREVVVIDKEDESGSKYLCAYLVSDQEITVGELRGHLSKKLSEYMIPSYFVQLNKMPLTPNGKIDRKALPEPDRSIVTGAKYEVARNEVEEKLVAIWKDVLAAERIGINDNFFDLGGNSINILRIANAINKEFNVNISIGELLLNQTIMELADSIHKETIFNRLECIVKLNKSRSKKNVFIIHGQDGDVYYYKDLAKLLESECNVYGVQSRGIKKECDLTVPIKDMLKYYLNEIKMIQKEGPYIIAAYCIGCIIAYDLIGMLEENNDIVEKCIFVDESSFIHEDAARRLKKKEKITKPFNIIKNVIFEKKDIYLDNQEDIFSNKKDIALSELKNYIPDKERIKEINVKIGRCYIPKRLIKTPTYVIKAEESELRKFTVKYWGKVVNSKVVLKEISGNHETIWQYPHVTELSNVFKEILND